VAKNQYIEIHCPYTALAIFEPLAIHMVISSHTRWHIANICLGTACVHCPHIRFPNLLVWVRRFPNLDIWGLCARATGMVAGPGTRGDRGLIGG
jgi:hypothetical protein